MLAWTTSRSPPPPGGGWLSRRRRRAFDVRDGLLAAGLDGATAVVLTGDGTGDTQYTTSSTLDTCGGGARLQGRVVLTSARPGRAGQARLVGEPAALRLEGAGAAHQGAGGHDERTAAGLRRDAAEVPTIAVEPPRTPAQMERAIKGLVDGRYAWTIFTSVNAVRAVWEKFAEHGLDARHFGGVKIACIGEATAEAVRAFGIQPELIPAGEQTSEGLLAEFCPHDEILDPVGRVLLPRADIATETLAAGLTERGWEVDDVTAYRTVRAAPPPAEIRDAIKSRRLRRGAVHVVVDGAQPRRHRRQAAHPHGGRRDRAEDRRHRRRVRAAGRRPAPHSSVPDLVEALAQYAVDLRERLAAMPAKQRRGSKVQGPTALRFSR